MMHPNVELVAAKEKRIKINMNEMLNYFNTAKQKMKKCETFDGCLLRTVI